MRAKLERKRCLKCNEEIMINRWLEHLGSKKHKENWRVNAKPEKSGPE